MIRPMCSVLTIGNLLLLVQTGASTRPELSTPRRRETLYRAPLSDVKLQCEAHGNPQPRYVWLKNEKELSSTSSIEMNSSNGNLIINEFRSDDAGRYTCRAVNVDGIAISPAVLLIEAKMDTRWDDPQQEKSVTEGDPVSLVCRNPPICVPRGTISWHKNKEELKLTDRTQIDQSGTLHFAYTELDDVGDYVCKIHNSVLDLMKLGSPVTLQVKQSHEVTPSHFKPRFASDVTAREALLDRELRLECIFSGRPLPKISWTHNGVQVSPQNDGGILTIKKVSVTDAGKYTCTAVNSVGTGTGAIQVVVKSGPIWVKAPDSQVVLEGNDANFTCKAMSVGSASPLHVTWQHEWTAITDARLTVSEDNITLTIHNVMMGDNDCVQCNVRNDIDYIQEDACLRVVNDTNDLPQTTISSNTEDTSPVGQAVDYDPEAVKAGSNDGLVAGLVITVVVAVVAGIVVVVIWKRQKKNNGEYLTVLRVKDPKDDFAEKAKRRQTV